MSWTTPQAACLAQPPETAKLSTSKILAAIESGLDYLISKQSPKDGGWHSQQYGQLKQGAASSGLVIYCISHTPESLLKERQTEIARAKGFVRRRIQKEGCVGNQDGSLDYPVYATAMLLTAHLKMDLGISDADARRMLNYLLTSQCSKQNGFAKGNVNSGGWDILGQSGPTFGKTPGANVSVTFYATEAIKQFEDQNPKDQEPRSRMVQENAKQWGLRISQESGDGGFYFSAIKSSPLNKAGAKHSGVPNSYGSATHDGIGILLNTGTELKNSQLQKSIEWTNRNSDLIVPGFEKQGKDAIWPNALQYYYLAAYSRNISTMRDSKSRANKIITHLLQAQKKNGSWQNRASNMREDDPLIATSFALIALCNLHQEKTK